MNHAIDTREHPPADGTASTEDTTSEPTDLRVERIAEHIASSLQEPEPLVAAIGAASGDLLLLHYRLGQALDECLAHDPDLLAALGELLPALNTFAKVGQQADRFLQLALKIQAAQQTLKHPLGAAGT